MYSPYQGHSRWEVISLINEKESCWRRIRLTFFLWNLVLHFMQGRDKGLS
jgi:hypothetical protein